MSDFYENLDLKYSEIAILMTTCNKYNPGTQTFYLQTLNPMQDKDTSSTTTPADASNIMNKDSSALGMTQINVASTIDLDLPKDIARWYPKKWIPPGTRFVVTFVGGDITKPQITGRDF
mgnify:CR=1 FL=1